MLTYAVHGTNIALVDRHSAIILGVPAARALDLWERKGATQLSLEWVLNELMREGVAELPDFAFIEIVDVCRGLVTVAVRGAGVVQTGDDTHSGFGAHTWVETTVEGVTQLTLSLGTVSETPLSTPLSLPVERGLVQTNEVMWGLEVPAQFSETRTTYAMCAEAEDGDAFEIVTPKVVSDRSFRGHNHPVDEQTVMRRSMPNWMLRFTNGKVIGIGDRVVIGRRPTPISVHGEQLEQVLSPQRVVSANHALILGEADGGVIVDLDSKNGTVVLRNDEEVFLVRDGAEFVLYDGDELDFGDGNLAEFVRAAAPGL